MRLKKLQRELEPTTYQSRRDRLHSRLDGLIATDWKDGQAARLLRRFRRHRDHLLTFLDDPTIKGSVPDVDATTKCTMSNRHFA